MLKTIKTAESNARRSVRCETVWILLIAALAATGCGRRPPERFFEYDTGKINLERVTYVTPRIRVGVDEFPLTDSGIETVTGRLSEGRYSYFDVRARIVFDEFTWQAYRSETFNKDDNPLTDKHIKEIERELKRVQNIYQSIR